MHRADALSFLQLHSLYPGRNAVFGICKVPDTTFFNLTAKGRRSWSVPGFFQLPKLTACRSAQGVHTMASAGACKRFLLLWYVARCLHHCTYASADSAGTECPPERVRDIWKSAEVCASMRHSSCVTMTMTHLDDVLT